MEKLKHLLDIVAAVTEVSKESITSKTKRSEVVFARKIFVCVSKKYGFPTALVARLLHSTPQGVNYLHTAQDCSKISESLKTEIRKRFESAI